MKEGRMHYVAAGRKVDLKYWVCLVFGFLILASWPISASAAINEQLQFSGKITNSDKTNITNGNYNFKFELYSAASGSAVLWSETWDGVNGRVGVTDGLFSVSLGAHTSLSSVDFDSSSIYLQIYFDPGNDGTYEESFSTRVRLTSAPYAFNAGKLSGKTEAEFGTLADSETVTGNWQFNNQLRFGDSDASNYVGFAAPGTVGTNLVWTLPATDGSSGQVLNTDGAGTLAWATVSSSLDGLSDVTITAVADNEMLAYDSASSNWINQTAAEAGLATTSDLSGYQTTVTWGNGLTYAAGTADVDYNTTNLKITATQLDTIQSIATAASPTFAGLALGSGNLTMTGSLGTTGARLTKGWFTDLEVTNAIVGSITGSSGSTTGNAATVTNGVYTTDTGTVTSTMILNGTIAAADLAAGSVTAPKLQSAAADLGAADVTVNFGNTNGAFNTNITTDGTITATTFIGALTGNADTVTTNANLTGPITSVGNTTSVASQTGTGSTFVMDTSPTLVTPTLGVATATSIGIGANTLDTAEWANLDGLNQTLATTSSPTFAGLTVGSLSGILQASAGVVSGSAAVDDLADVVITSVADNEVLAYNSAGGNWINQTAAEAGLATTGDLHDAATVTDSVTIDFTLTGQEITGSVIQSGLDHGSIGGLTDDDHTQYALLAGRAGGQILYGGTGDNDDITIEGTSSATKTTSYVILQPTAGNVGIGITTPNNLIQVAGLINFNNSIQGTFLGYQAGNVATGASNSFIGYQAGLANTTGGYNTAVGHYALLGNTTGDFNSVLGDYALDANTTGSNNSAFGRSALGGNISGNYNSAFGTESLYSNTASNNSASGYEALFLNTTGADNTALGYKSLYSNTTVGQQTAVGSQALYSNVTGAGNSALGYRALYLNTSYQNTAVGWSALENNSTGNRNSALGYGALQANTTGYDNVAVGSQALLLNTQGYSNSAVGLAALTSNTTGYGNSAFGTAALYSNATGNYNSALGVDALMFTTGDQNTGVGGYTLYENLTGAYNASLGVSALRSNTTGNNNLGLGVSALRFNTTGSSNVVLGYWAGYGVENSSNVSNNVLLGYKAGAALLTGGDNNILLGYQAGNNLTTGANNIIIGYDIDAAAATTSNQLNLGNLIYGDTSTGKVGLGQVANTYLLSFPAATVDTGGIDFGGDVTLYRSAVDTLKTDDAFLAANLTSAGLTSGRVTYAGTAGILQDSANMTFNTTNGLILAAGSTSALQLSSTAGTAVGGLLFGTDTNLYRSGANILMTDDAVVIGAQLDSTAKFNVQATALAYGVYVEETSASGSGVGVFAHGKKESTNSTGSAYGIKGRGEKSSGVMVITDVVGGQFQALSATSGTTAYTKGVEILANTTTNTPTNNAGIYIAAQAGGSTNYGIALAGTGIDNQINWSTDTNLYRSAENILKTDDTLTVGDALNVTGTTTLATSLTGLLKAASGIVSVAAAGTDYQAAGSYITALTGDVTATGPGSVTATIANGAVSLAKMANMATASFLGRNTAETGVPEVLSASTAKSILAIAQADVSGLTTDSSPQFAGLTLTGSAALDGGITIDTNNFTVSGSTGAVGIVAAQTTGTTLGVSYDVATQTGALTGLALDFTNITTDATNAVYGIKLDDPASNTASVEYGIYQAGTNWDYGAYFDDLVRIADSGLVLGSTAVTSTAAELNILDGATLTVTEMNYLDGTVVTAGGVIFGNATYLANSGAGNTGELLTSAGTGTPTWTAQSSVNAGQLDSLDSTDFLRATASDTYEGSNDRTLTIQSALTAAARTANLVTISQANDATYDQTAGVLFNVSQADTASTTNVAYLQNAGAGYALAFEQGTTTADGIVWGADANLVTLYRSANDTLKTDDAFLAANLTSAGLTSGRVTYAGTAGILQDSANLTYDGTTFNHGVPTAALTGVIGAAAIKVNTTSAIALGGENTTASSNTQGAFVDLFSNDGAAMAADDRLGGIIMGGSYSASALIRSAAVAAFAENLWVDGSDYGTYLRFETIATGAILRTEKMRLTSVGQLQLYNGSSTGGLVFGDGAGAYDTNLYRSDANILQTDDAIRILLGGGSRTTYAGGGDDFIIDHNASGGMTIATASDGVGEIHFADVESTSQGYIKYTHSTDSLTLGAAGNTAITVSNGQQVSLTGRNTAGSGADVLTVSSTLNAMNGSDTFRGLYLNLTNADHTGATNVLYGIDLTTSGADAQASEYAINIGTGWDAAINLANTASNVDFRSAKADTAGTSQFLFNTSATVSSATLFAVQNNGTDKFLISAAGTITDLQTYSDTVGGANRDLYVDDTGKFGYVSSSIRYKKNVSGLNPNDTDWLYNLRPVAFDYIDPAQGSHQIGLIAEEVEQTIPELVSYSINDPSQPETVSYSKLVVPLLNAVQGLHTSLTAVEQEAGKLANQLQTFSNEIGNALATNTLTTHDITTSSGDLVLSADSGNVKVAASLEVDGQVILHNDLTVDGAIAGASINLGDQSSGHGTITQNNNQVFITSQVVKNDDKIILTPRYNGSLVGNEIQLFKGDITEDQGFWVKLLSSNPLTQNLEFDWLIVK